MIEKALDHIKNQNLSISQWMIGFTGIFLIRLFFESLSSPTSSGIIPSDPYTIIHYGLFFLSITLGTACIVGYFTKDYLGTAKIILFGLPVIWIAPIADIVLSHGKGYKMTYLFDTGRKLFFDFLTFFGPSLDHSATYGMRLGIAIILMGIGWYIWIKTGNSLKVILGTISSYAFGFIMGSLPGILYTISNFSLNSASLSDVLVYFEKIIWHSTITHNTFREGVVSISASRFFELGFDKFLTQILFIICVFFAALLFWKIDSKKFLAVIGNLRLERINFYLFSILCGMGFAYINNFGLAFVWTDLFGIASMLIAWIGLWMYAVHTNDIVDIEIDKISNQNRPLVKHELTSDSMHQVGKVWLAIGLLGAWSAGFYPFFMSLIYIAASYIYSSPPLRLRQFPIVSSFLIGVACLATILAGFFFVSIHKEIQAFPMLLSMGIIIMVTLAINFKDLKDVEGDRKEGIITIPTIFKENGPKVVGFLMAFSIFLVPIFLKFYFLYIFALPASIIGYKIITKKPYREKPVFVLRFVFLACIALSYLAIYWLGHLYNLI